MIPRKPVKKPSPFKKKKKVIDVGPSTGESLVRKAQREPDKLFYGIEFEKSKAEKARELIKSKQVKNAWVANRSVTNVPFKKKTIDEIRIDHVLSSMHIPSKKDALKRKVLFKETDKRKLGLKANPEALRTEPERASFQYNKILKTSWSALKPGGIIQIKEHAQHKEALQLIEREVRARIASGEFELVQDTHVQDPRYGTPIRVIKLRKK